MSDITQWIRNELYENSEEGYKDFHSSLVPGISNILGVRVPKLREIAKKAAKEDYREFINHVDTQVYEELMLWGRSLRNLFPTSIIGQFVIAVVLLISL